MNVKKGTKDELKGKFHEVKGKAKEKAGWVTDDPNYAAEGTDEKLSGIVKWTLSIGHGEVMNKQKREGKEEV